MKAWKPTVAGILSIIAGAFSLIVGLAAVMRVARAARILFHWRLETMGSLAIVLGIIAIIGGIFAIKRQIWGLALAGAICALFPPHVAVLGILAIIFVSLSKGEFTTTSISSPPAPPQPPSSPPAQSS